MPSIRHVEPTANELHYEADESASDDEVDCMSDPFEILAAREERSGTSLIHMTVDHDD